MKNCHLIIETAYSFLAFIGTHEREKELVRTYERKHPPPSVAAPKDSVTNSTLNCLIRIYILKFSISL